MTTANAGAVQNALYELLPAVFRQQDIAQGYPLLALTKVFDQIRLQLAAGVSGLEQDWFIQTCPLDYVPLIGALLGLQIARPVRPEHRALVADTLGFRRRKGIAAALPRLVRDSSGWYSLYAPGVATPWASRPLGDAPAPAGEQAGILRVWRLPVFAMVGATPAPAAAANFYHFNPWGMDQGLFNLPNTPLDWVAAPPVTALPAAITTAMLAADLARYDAIWPDPGTGLPNSLLYGPARGLVIRTQTSSTPWTALLPGQIRAMRLSGTALVAPDYPVLQGSAMTLAGITAVTSDLTITFGDAKAALSVAVPAAPGMAQLVMLLQNAIASATITPGTRVSAAAVKALAVGAVGTALAIVPGQAASEPLAIAPTQPGGPDPLLLAGSSLVGIAAATLPLTPQLIGLLTGAPPDSLMTFTAPAGQVLNVPLPLTLATPTAAAAAQAFAAALPTCFVCAAGDQVVIVPPPAQPVAPPLPTAPARALGLVPAVAIDPERGLFNWPSAWGPAGTLSVDYGLAMPGAIGGIGVRPSLPTLPSGAVDSADGGAPAWLEQQLGAWAQSKAAVTMLTLQGSVTRGIASQQIAPTSGQSLWIVGAAGSQPYVVTASPGTLSLLGPPPPAVPSPRTQPGTVAWSGIALAASIALPGGDIDLVLRDTTLYPGASAPALTTPPPAAGSTAPVVAAGSAMLSMERCILGPIDLPALSGDIAIDSSVLCALPAPDRLRKVLVLPDTMSARFTRLTLIGAGTIAGKLQALDSLFDGILACAGDAQFTNCYVRDLQYAPGGDSGMGDAAAAAPATVARCGTCGKARSIRLVNGLLQQVFIAPAMFCRCEVESGTEVRNCVSCTDPACAGTCPLRAAGQSWEPMLEPPRFVEPNVYPLPNFARLSDDNPATILAGASNHDELGAYNLAAPTSRLVALEAALRAGLLPGTQLEQRFES